MSTEEILALLKKANIDTATVGGLLNTEQANSFLDTVIDQSPFLKSIRTEREIGTARQLSIMGTTPRQIRKAVEGQVPTNLGVVGVTTRTLTPVEIILPYNISFKWLEENIAKGNAEAMINAQFGKQFGNDILDLAINGSKADVGTDKDFLNIIDGWFTQLAADVDNLLFDREGGNDWLNLVFPGIVDKIPQKYANEQNFVLLVNKKVDSEYRRQIGARPTTGGDTYIMQHPEVMYDGKPIKVVPFLPYGTCALTTLDNLAVGFGRDIRIGKWLNERARQIEYTITAKVDANYVLNEKLPFCQ